MLSYIKEKGKPVVINFIGGDKKKVEAIGKVGATTLEEAAVEAVKLAEASLSSSFNIETDEEIKAIAKREAKLIKPEQKYLRGLYSGGTLCYESMLVLRDYIGDVYSNTPLNNTMKLEDATKPTGNCCIDYGDDQFTVGRAHPMIDTTLREEEFMKEIEKDDVAVIIMDVVIGYGTHKDPAGVLQKELNKQNKTRAKGKHVPIICYVCGTDEDPQNWTEQNQNLKKQELSWLIPMQKHLNWPA